MNQFSMNEFCCYCGLDLSVIKYNNYKKRSGLATVFYSVDHLVPKSKGGNNGHLNKMGCCSKCNVEKDNKTIDQYIYFLKKEINYVNQFKNDKYFHIDYDDTVGNVKIKYALKLINAKKIADYIEEQGIKLYKNKQTFIQWNKKLICNTVPIKGSLQLVNFTKHKKCKTLIIDDFNLISYIPKNTRKWHEPLKNII